MNSGTVGKYSDYFNENDKLLSYADVNPSKENPNEKLKKQYGYCIKNSIIQNDDPNKCQRFIEKCVSDSGLNISADACKDIFTKLETQKLVEHQALFGPRLGSDGNLVKELYNGRTDLQDTIKELYVTHKIITQSEKNSSTGENMKNFMQKGDVNTKANFMTEANAITQFSSLTTNTKTGKEFLTEFNKPEYNAIWDNLKRVREYFKDSYNSRDKTNDLVRMFSPPHLPLGLRPPSLGVKIDKKGKYDPNNINYHVNHITPVPGASVNYLSSQINQRLMPPAHPFITSTKGPIPYLHPLFGGNQSGGVGVGLLGPQYVPAPLNRVVKKVRGLDIFKSDSTESHFIIKKILGCDMNKNISDCKDKLKRKNLMDAIKDVSLDNDKKETLKFLLSCARVAVGLPQSLEEIPLAPILPPYPGLLHIPSLFGGPGFNKSKESNYMDSIRHPTLPENKVPDRIYNALKPPKGVNKKPDMPPMPPTGLRMSGIGVPGLGIPPYSISPPVIPVLGPRFPNNVGSALFMGGGNQKFPKLKITKDMVGGTVFKNLSTFLNRNEINSIYMNILETFPQHIKGGDKVKGQKYPENFPKIVVEPLNISEESIKNIDHNKHFVYNVKKMIDFYLGVARKHNINIPFESQVRKLLKSIHLNQNKYNQNVLELQNIQTVKVNKSDLTIDRNDLKYDSEYQRNIKTQIERVNNSRRILHTELKLLFSIEENLYNLVKFQLVKHYAE